MERLCNSCYEKQSRKNLLFKKCHCAAYLRKVNDGACICRLMPKQTEDGQGAYLCYPSLMSGEEPFESPCEGAFDIEKTYYKREERNFSGFCVGFREITTEAYLGVDTHCHPDGSEYHTVFKEPKTRIDCAVVYFASGKKRLVPLDAILERRMAIGTIAET